MRIAHLADAHLGYRAYNRVTRQGINWREADVFQAFRSALDKVAEIQPELILIAGDLFHAVRPSNLSIEQTFKEFLKLRDRTQAPLVIIGGNHDSPRSADTGCILDLFRNIPNVLVSHRDFERQELPDLGVAVSCLGWRAVQRISEWKVEPSAQAKANVLIVHGTLEDIKLRLYDPTPILRDQVALEQWDYVALGHYHIHHKIAANAYYSGSLEFTSFNIWEEVGIPKGFIEYDLNDHELIGFHQVETREVVSLRPLDAREYTAEELSKSVQDFIENIDGGHKDKIIRLVIENIPRSVQTDLDYAMIRRLKTEALHLELQFRPPTPRSGDTPAHDGPAKPLEEEWRDFATAYQTAAGVDRAELAELGAGYLTGQASQEASD